MKKIICEAYNGKRILFTYDFPFFIEKLSGFHDVIGTVVGEKSAFGVGETYIDTSIEKRNIIIEGFMIDNLIENRQKLFQTFPLKKEGTLFYYEDDISRKISYEVESVIVSDSGCPRTFQISLICNNPYFTDVEKTVLSMATWTPMFKFPLKSPVGKGFKFATKNTTSMAVIQNDSNIEFGIIITFKANDLVKNPSLFNVDSREEMKISKTMQSGDKIIVNTYRQNKNIVYISSETGKEENINNLMIFGSKFLQVHIGLNTFRYNADENVDNLEAVIEYYKEYEAV